MNKSQLEFQLDSLANPALNASSCDTFSFLNLCTQSYEQLDRKVNTRLLMRSKFKAYFIDLYVLRKHRDPLLHKAFESDLSCNSIVFFRSVNPVNAVRRKRESFAWSISSPVDASPKIVCGFYAEVEGLI